MSASPAAHNRSTRTTGDRRALALVRVRPSRAALVTSILSATLLFAGAGPTEADPCRPRYGRTIRSGIALKLGVYSPDAPRASDGFYGGLEYAALVAPALELALGADYFYRSRHSNAGLVQGDGPYDIPVDGEVSRFEASTHLGAFGGTARVRFPSKGFTPVPFVEGGLAAQLLHLRAPADSEFGGGHVQSDTFAGWGWHLGAGLEVPVGPQASVLGEFGWNHAEPTKEEEIQGSLVTLKADASGAYARFGVRFFQ